MHYHTSSFSFSFDNEVCLLNISDSHYSRIVAAEMNDKYVHSVCSFIGKKKKIVNMSISQFFFVGLPKRAYRMAYSSSVRHSLRGMKTLGLLIPAVTSRNVRISVPYVGLNRTRETGMHPWSVHVPIYGTVSLFGNVKFPLLDIWNRCAQ